MVSIRKTATQYEVTCPHCLDVLTFQLDDCERDGNFWTITCPDCVNTVKVKAVDSNGFVPGIKPIYE